MATAHLGEFPKARRGSVKPGDVGLRSRGSRRVSGLRREEVAVLAEVSIDYYTRLEQGRERHPSASVLDALSRALDLDDDARTHLFAVAGSVPVRSGSRPPQAVSPDLLQLMDGWTHTPAFVTNATLDVLASNNLAEALFAGPTERSNLLRAVFLDAAASTFYVARDRAAEAAVAHLRTATATDPDDPRTVELVAELSTGSELFRRLWQEQHVRGKTRDAKRFRHPDVGDLTLTYQTFDVRAAPGQQLVVYQAEPGSATARALSLLGSLVAEPRSEADRGARSATAGRGQFSSLRSAGPATARVP